MIIKNVIGLSLQMYGCRVVQKALEVMTYSQQQEMVQQLDGSVIKLIKDQNGNHVIQKAVESVPSELIGFIPRAFLGQVQSSPSLHLDISLLSLSCRSTSWPLILMAVASFSASWNTAPTNRPGRSSTKCSTTLTSW